MSGGERSPPEWWGAPSGWIGGVIPGTVVVARNAKAVILAEAMVVYPTGIGMRLRAMLRPAPRPVIQARKPRSTADAAKEPPLLNASIYAAAVDKDWEPPELPADRVAFGVEFEDGRRATRAEQLGGPAGDFSFRAHYEEKDVAPDPAVNVILNCIGGGGSSDSIAEKMFVWPLPRGDLRLFGSWSDADMREQVVELRAGVISDALTRARRVFEV
jgi:hypothetical protein